MAPGRLPPLPSSTARIRSIRAYVPVPASSGNALTGHWIDDHVASPMARWPEHRDRRSSFGFAAMGPVVVIAEAEDGTTGLAVGTGGEVAAFVVERQLALVVEGQPLADLGELADRMYAATVHVGRKGVVVNAISVVDLALWDLLGQLRGEPVHALLGGAVRSEQLFYATGVRPDAAQTLGFAGAKLPLHHGPAEGADGAAANLADLAAARDQVGSDFPLMWDCWMSLDVGYARELAGAAAELGLHWIEEPLLPDDYWGSAELRRRCNGRPLVATGEHEWTAWGFRLLLDYGCADVLQPDVAWCGGMTELLRIAALADSAGVPVVPHGSGVYSHHFTVTRPGKELADSWAEFLLLSPTADEVVAPHAGLLLDEPVPVDGRLPVSALDRPGFGVRLDPARELRRPYPR